jgi:hypothetical protein
MMLAKTPISAAADITSAENYLPYNPKNEEKKRLFLICIAIQSNTGSIKQIIL